MEREVRWPWDDAADRINRTLDGVANILVRVAAHLQQIELQQRLQTEAQGRTMTLTDEILSDVTAQKTVVDGVLVLVQALAAAKDDPAKLQAIADQLVANTGALQGALDANVQPAP